MNTGQYWDLLARGFLKPEDHEPLIEGLEFYFDAFRELSTCRPGGMGLHPIPFTAIVEYFRIYLIDEDLDEFVYLIRRMDDVVIEDNAAEADKKRGDSGGQHNGNKTNSRNR